MLKKGSVSLVFSVFCESVFLGAGMTHADALDSCKHET